MKLAEGVYKVRVLAAIMVLEDIAEGMRCDFDFNERQAGLAGPSPIDRKTISHVVVRQRGSCPAIRR
jgi:hypothetical protein